MKIPPWFRAEHSSKSIETDRPPAETILSELDHLESHIHGGWNEQQIQRFLKEKPYLLAGKLRTGHGSYAFPEQSLGGKYFADWLLASGNSSGMEWQLVELESPAELPFMRDGHPSEATRKGLNQIHDWREWLQRNLDFATRPPSQHGLGLYDIRPRTFGLVVVGQRRAYQSEPGVAAYNDYRNAEYEDRLVKIESYESFIESLRFRYKTVSRQ